jgi:hypothetical protein
MGSGHGFGRTYAVDGKVEAVAGQVFGDAQADAPAATGNECYFFHRCPVYLPLITYR